MAAEAPISATQFDLGEIVARPYRPDDAPALLAAVRESIDSVGRWLPWCHAGYGEAESVAWIAQCTDAWARGDHYTFGVFEGTEFLGAVGINHRNREHNFASIGYWMRTSRQGQGVTPRVGRFVAKFGFEQVKLNRIEIVAALENRASRRTAERIGGRFEGIARSRLIVASQAVDAAVYALAAGDVIDAM
jgi:ribosomal-protein-serine acetyltransferase